MGIIYSFSAGTLVPSEDDPRTERVDDPRTERVKPISYVVIYDRKQNIK